MPAPLAESTAPFRSGRLPGKLAVFWASRGMRITKASARSRLSGARRLVSRDPPGEVPLNVDVDVVGDVQEVVDVDEFAILGERLSPPNGDPWAAMTPSLTSVKSTSARILNDCSAGGSADAEVRDPGRALRGCRARLRRDRADEPPARQPVGPQRMGPAPESTDQIVERFGRLAEAGVQHVIISTADAHDPAAIELLGRDVLRQLRGLEASPGPWQAAQAVGSRPGRRTSAQAAFLYQSSVAAMASRCDVTTAPKACSNFEWSTIHGLSRWYCCSLTARNIGLNRAATVKSW